MYTSSVPALLRHVANNIRTGARGASPCWSLYLVSFDIVVVVGKINAAVNGVENFPNTRVNRVTATLEARNTLIAWGRS